ncbi:hypothetical protein BGZ80_006278 [Entomortierella chlamydospora]|uniref:Glutathione S-transferase C-terminal domain-containing protein n=1 Tax=Entomortierella chlamydospora TaxID=101097 RepID=A0A9P6MH52_9FUNG|nr:hypothetical protein BGZ80_006278 [Entomortierella chlamydospora]
MRDGFEKRAKNFPGFNDESLTKFIKVRKNRLKNNGSNEFYVGGSLSLADIKATIFIDRMTFLRPKDVQEVVFSAEKILAYEKSAKIVEEHKPLIIQHTDGTGESQTIERYLATKLDLFGKNEYEHHKVEQFLTSTDIT